MNRELAEETSLLALKISADLNQHLFKIKAQCSEAETKQYALATGKVLADMLFEVMNPIYAEHPDLKPVQLGGEYDYQPEKQK